MAVVVNKNTTGTPPVGNGTVEVLQSANTPDFSTANWFINPDLSSLNGIPVIYWKIVGGATIEEMSSVEKAQVDASSLPISTEVAGVSSVVSTTTSSVFVTKITTNPIRMSGDYDLIISYGWNLDSTTNDFEAKVQESVDAGSFVDIGELHTQEPSDSAGTFGVTGSGQKMYITRVIQRTNLVEGEYSWRLQWRSVGGGNEASIWDASIIAKRSTQNTG